ncbi:hypothetical protein C8J56DRAFT_196892 [Mycena floridula]|nr:hypothetical protein C8J56DRAFT_196892 [Mycena floridula]
MLERPSSPLHTLEVCNCATQSPEAWFDEPRWIQILSLFPEIHIFKLTDSGDPTSPSTGLPQSFIRRLAETSEPKLLPKLHQLALTCMDPELGELLDMIESRRLRLSEVIVDQSPVSDLVVNDSGRAEWVTFGKDTPFPPGFLARVDALCQTGVQIELPDWRDAI